MFRNRKRGKNNEENLCWEKTRRQWKASLNWQAAALALKAFIQDYNFLSSSKLERSSTDSTFSVVNQGAETLTMRTILNHPFHELIWKNNTPLLKKVPKKRKQSLQLRLNWKGSSGIDLVICFCECGIYASLSFEILTPFASKDKPWSSWNLNSWK